MPVDAATLVALAAALAGVLAYVAFGRGLSGGKRADGLKHFSSLPSPLGLPLVGHGPLLGRSPAAALRRWADKHGGMYRITVAGKPVAVISDPALLLEASALPKPSDGQHAGTHAAISGPSALEAAADVSSSSSSSSSSSAEASAKAVRTAFDLACSKDAASGKGGYLEALADAGGALTSALINAGPDQAVDMHDLLERAALDAAVAGAVGLPVGPAVGEEDAEPSSASFVPKALDPTALKDRRPQPESELLGAIRAARASTPSTSILKKPSSAPAAAVADAREKFAALATKLEARGAPRAADASAGAALVRSGVSGAELAANLSTAVLHGASPVAAAAAWVLATLASEPTAADKVTRELMEAGLLCHGDDRAPKRVGAADLHKLPFLSACVRETMRLHSTGMPAAGLLRQVPCSSSSSVGTAYSVGGVALPAGCLVVLASPVAATSAASFPQPQRFWPEGRWLESALPRGHVYKSIDEKVLPVMAFALKKSPAGPAGAFAPLGLDGGPSSSRACPASAIAADAVAVLAGAVLANFRHRLADDVGGMKGVLASRASAGEAGGADAGHCGGTFGVASGLQMVCVPRSSTGFSRNV